MSRSTLPFVEPAPAGTWGSWTPVLTSAGTHPNIGSDGVRGGRFLLRPDNTVEASAFWQFGASGSSAGTATYLITLPIAPSTTLTYGVLGSFYAYDSSASAFAQGLVIRYDATRAQMLVAGGGLLSASAPWAWANGDVLITQYRYEAA